MSKPEDIPQDVWEAARSLWLVDLNFANDRHGAIPVIARAIIAAKAEEREACAQIAEGMPIQIYRDEGVGPAGRSCKPANFDDIAAAIRKRGEG